jgi:hypothetical protein
MAKTDSGDCLIWTGIAQEVEKRREIKARHRTGRGVFYAVLHVWHQDSPRERTEIDTIEVQCNGKKAAIEAVRHLLAENAHRFSEDVTLEAEVISELEWEPGPSEEPSEDSASEANSV